MAGTLNVDTLKADSNLRLQIASANVAFIDVNGLTIVGNSLNVGGGRIAVTSNSAIINPTITTPTIAGNLNFDSTGTTGVRSPEANTLTFHTAGTEDMRINSVGGVQFNGSISVGGVTPTTSGAGITFPATQSASTDANTLDDYEEGTWTPSYYGSSSAGTTTYASRNGTYQKIGNCVFCEWYLDWSSKTGTGDALIGGLPFTASGYSTDSRALFYLGAYGQSYTGTLSSVIQSSGTNLILYVNNNGSLAGQGIANSGYIRFAFWYRTST